MSYTNTISETFSFTRTDSKHISYKVATDLKRVQRLYGTCSGQLSDSWIKAYEDELIEYLKAGYLNWVAYGFYRNGQWIEPTLYYTAQYGLDAALLRDDSPGAIRPRADVNGAGFHSLLARNHKWNQISEAARREFSNRLPFSRTSGKEPGFEGRWVNDRTYSTNGRMLGRCSLRSC